MAVVPMKRESAWSAGPPSTGGRRSVSLARTGGRADSVAGSRPAAGPAVDWAAGLAAGPVVDWVASLAAGLAVDWAAGPAVGPVVDLVAGLAAELAAGPVVDLVAGLAAGFPPTLLTGCTLTCDLRCGAGYTLHQLKKLPLCLSCRSPFVWDAT